MLDIVRGAYVRAYLRGVSARAAAAAEALDWLDGTQTLSATQLVPPFAEGSAGQAAFRRFAGQVQSLGPRAFRFKRDGTLGAVNWGGDSTTMDARLESIDLVSLATPALKGLFANGIAAAWAYQPEVGPPRVQRLGGHLEPLYLEDDAAGDPIGLFQVRAQPDGARYTLRVYEFSLEPGRGTIYEWRDAQTMFEIGKVPTLMIENTSVPRVQIANRSQDGLPLGEFGQALPTVIGEVAQQLRLLRVADAHAWPLTFAAGDWDIPRDLGSQSILTAGSTDAKVGKLEPSDLTTLFQQHDRVLERFRADTSLPIGSINTGNFPSGEALEQANATYLSSCRSYAAMLSRLLTDVVADYAALVGISDPPPVTVNINQEFTKGAITSTVIELWREGLIDFAAAVRAVSVYVPTWSSDEVEAYIQREAARGQPLGFVPGALTDDA